jgi:uncharacterized protein (UPF0276 family)
MAHGAASERPLVGLSLMPGDDFRQAAYPLFEAGEVEILEWSFDVGWGPAGVPAWVRLLIDAYAESDRLLGHGVTLSLFSGAWQPRQEQWLARLEGECRERSYRHVSEHFGFMTAGGFEDGAPLPVPMTPSVLALGRERLLRLADVTGRPVGLENLAFAFGLDDVRGQGELLGGLLDQVDGFLVLDLHNLYCQAANFGQEPERLLESYPLDRVRELHVSGGSWSTPSVPGAAAVRRDTHDGAVPEEVFALADLALARCGRVEAVILERLDGTLGDPAEAEQLRRDYRRLAALVQGTARAGG